MKNLRIELCFREKQECRQSSVKPLERALSGVTGDTHAGETELSQTAKCANGEYQLLGGSIGARAHSHHTDVTDGGNLEQSYLPKTFRRTVVTPAFSIRKTRAARRERSIMRPRTKGPRSLIRTTTLRPLLRRVTRTRVPNGSVL